jgi:hypothetical protein
MIEEVDDGITVWCDYCSCYDETFDVEGEDDLRRAMTRAGWGIRTRDGEKDHKCPSCMEERKPW